MASAPAAAAAAFIRPALEAVIDAAGGRKHTELRHEARSLLLRLDDVLSGEGGGGGDGGRDVASADGAASVAAASEPAAASAAASPRPTEDAAAAAPGLASTTGSGRLEVAPPAAAAAPDDDDDDGGGGEGGGGGGSDATPPPPPPQPYTGSLPAAGATEVLRVLWLAVDARRPALMSPALDAAARLAAGGFVGGVVHAPARGPPPPPPPPLVTAEGDEAAAAAAAAALLSGPPPPPPQAVAVGLLCSAADPARAAAAGEPLPADDALDLRILRGVLTAATAPGLHLHGGGLLQALRAAYTVFLGARTEGTRLTARAALTQVVSATFARLEATAAAAAAAGAGGASAVEVAAAAAALPPAPSAAGGDGGLGGGLSAAASAAHAAAASFVADVLAAVGVGGGGGGVSAGAGGGTDAAGASGGGVAAPAVAAALDVAFSAPRPSGGGGGGGGAGGVAGRAPPPGEGPAGSDPPSLCVSPTVAAGAGAAPWPEPFAPDPAAAAATARRDAFLVFRALCKLGARPGGADGGSCPPLSASAAAAADAAAARGRVLALELLHGVLEGAGPAFAADARLAAAARQYLCLTLLKNARSPHAPAARAAAAVFTAALVRLRPGLKAEVGVFYPMLLLAPLEPVGSVAPRGGGGGGGSGGAAAQPTSPTAAAGTAVSAPPADPAARAAALRCLARVCADGPLLVDLFVNYDCDLEGAALFERTVLALVRVARGGAALDDFSPSAEAGAALALPPPPPPPPTPDEAAARAAAAACLASALRALVAWVEGGGPAGPGGGGAAAGAAAARAGSALASVDPAAAAWAAGRADWAALATRGAGRPAAAPEGGGDGPPPPEAAGQPPPPAPPSSAASEPAPSSAVAVLAQRRAYKRDFAAALALFNTHPKKGLRALQEGGMLAADDPAAVAAFLASTPGLDKTAVGEYLGEREDGALAVMHAYVDALDFTGATFDGALRSFLAGFRLPGEAQKIDRLVEKFAARYVECNPGAFGSADTAYVLAYSVVMLNTDAHNPQVKVKMSRADFIRNNRGINDGGDLPEAYLSAIYDAITTNEIRMKDDDGGGGGAAAAAASAAPAGPTSWMDTLFSLFPGSGGGSGGGGGGAGGAAAAGRTPGAPSPAEAAAIRRTHDLLRSAARTAGAGFVAPPDAAAARPMVEAVWGPVLGALAAGFEGAGAGAAADGAGAAACLAGLVAAARLAATVRAPPGGPAAVARTVAALTRLHAPSRMGLRHAQALRALLVIGDECGDALGVGGWDAVLRGASRWDLVANGGGGDGEDGIFGGGGDAGASDASAATAATSRRGLFGRSTTPTAGALAAAAAAARPPPPTSVLDAPLTGGGGGPRGPSADGSVVGATASPLPPSVAAELDSQELDRLFVGSDRLGSEAVVDFVVALLAVAREELGLGAPSGGGGGAGGAPPPSTTAAAANPRLFSLDKVVTVAHFNMGCRIRLVWGRVWALLAAFFTDAGTHRGSPSVALHAVDALRQLAVKFLARPELAAFSFQADFLKPFVAIVRGSRDPAVRELVLACAAQLAAARAPQIKSGWKAMFSVFSSAAADADPAGVRAGFEAVERVVRDHFAAIAGSEAGAFTDCVNCLVAYANAAPGPPAAAAAGHASGGAGAPDVPLQAIAFLRFCAAALADEGGKVQAEAAAGSAPASAAAAAPAAAAVPAPLHPDALRIRPAGVTADLDGTEGGGPAASPASSPTRRVPPPPLADEDRLYLWFPLLAGLAELTFDPRPDTRAAAAEVLFDALACHGGAFSPGAWARIFGSILLPVFDHVRAGVLGGVESEYTTFASPPPLAAAPGGGGGGGTGEASTDGGAPPPPPPTSSASFPPPPADPDAWLYEAATRCLGRTIDVAAAHWAAAGPAALPGLLDLAASLAARPSAPLAAVGVAAWARLVAAVGDRLSPAEWGEAAGALARVAAETAPALESLVAWRSGGRATATDGVPSSSAPSLAAGAGARRLGEARARAGTQALVVQAAADALARFHSPGGVGGGSRAARGNGAGPGGEHPVGPAAMPQAAADALLAALAGIADRAAALDADRALRAALAGAQDADGVPAGRRLPDPPLLGLEAEAGRALLAIGGRAVGSGGDGDAAAVDLIASTAARALEAVELAGAEAPGEGGGGGADAAAAAARAEAAARAPLAAAALWAVRTAPPPLARRLLARLFPRVTAVLACPHAPPEVLAEVAALLAERVAPLLAAAEQGGGGV